MIKGICDPNDRVVPSVNCIGEDADQVIPSIFAIIEKKGYVVHGLTPQTGGRWVAAHPGVGAEVTNQMQNI